MGAKNSQILTVFESALDHPGAALYTSALHNSLRRIFPDPFFFDSLDEERQEEAVATFERALPLLKWSLSGDKLSLFFLGKNRFNISKIFYDIINQWLMPGQRIDISFFFSTDFKLVNLGHQVYTLAEMVVQLNGAVDLELLKHNLRVIETEIRLGMVSFYHTNRILEVHGMRAAEKHANIQEKIVTLIQKRPEEIDYDIFGEMQHFFVMSKDEFKSARDTHYLSRLISLFYIFRKVIQHSLEKESNKRHIRLKIHSVNLNLPWGMKRVLGICVGLNFLKPDELFEERHLVKALQNAIVHVKPVQDSFFVNEGGGDGIHTLYLEIEKEDGLEFSKEEISKLRLSFPEQLKRCIEVALKPLFMPRNEEEVIRHIVTLAGELRFVKDLPQLILSFDEQRETELCFTAIIVRILFPNSPSIEEKFEKQQSVLTFSPDRVKRLGMLRKKYPKEATVFRVGISSERYVREDGSLDLFKARQDVVHELQHIIGEMRDYNGGMISKQVELLRLLKSSLGSKDELLVESLFHALFPIEMRSILSFELIKNLFTVWKELLDKPDQEKIVKVEPEGIYFMEKQENTLMIELFDGPDLLLAKPTYRGAKFFGGIYFYKSEENKRNFIALRA